MTNCIITRVTAVRPLGDNLSVVNVEGIEHSVVANRLDDGSFRWEEGEVAVYIPEEAIVPDNILKQRGYWNDEKGIGLLGGKKGNRVKMRRFGPEEERVESRGLLFKLVKLDQEFEGNTHTLIVDLPERAWKSQPVKIGDDVTEYLGITFP